MRNGPFSMAITDTMMTNNTARIRLIIVLAVYFILNFL